MPKNKRPGKIKLWSVAVWLIIWQICALIIGQNILLVSPVTAFQRLFELACTGEFWLSITFSLLRIIGGFLAACIAEFFWQLFPLNSNMWSNSWLHLC
ncbi:MAG: hypothetical protein ACLR13_04835 [Acutalibacteraceae bacterium]